MGQLSRSVPRTFLAMHTSAMSALRPNSLAFTLVIANAILAPAGESGLRVKGMDSARRRVGDDSANTRVHLKTNEACLSISSPGIDGIGGGDRGDSFINICAICRVWTSLELNERVSANTSLHQSDEPK